MGHKPPEPRNAQLPDHASVDTGASEAATAPAGQFTTAGALPPVVAGHGVAAPSASDRAFGAGTQVRVTASGLHVRQSPQVADGNIVGGMYRGDQADVLGTEHGWVNVRFGGVTGFVSGEWVEPVTSAGAPQAEAKPAAHEAEAKPAAHEAQAKPAAHGAGPAAPPLAMPTQEAPAASASVGGAVSAGAKTEREAPDDGAALRTEMDAVVGLFDAGAITHDQAVAQFEAFDQLMHGGSSSMTGMTMLPALFAKLGQHAAARAAQAHNAHVAATPAPAAPAPAAPATAAPAPAHGTAPAADQGTTDHTAWVPPPGATLEDPKLLALVAKTNGKVASVVPKLAGVLALDKELRKGRNQDSYFEVHGKSRESMIAGIGAVRADLATLDTSDPSVAAFVLEVNHRMEAIAPYHFQLNIKSVESPGGWSTCNFTSMAMALETVGLSPANYKSSKHAALLKVAEHFKGDVAGARLASNGKGVTLSELQGLRLPDFLELAAVVHALGGKEPTAEAIQAAAVQVVGDKIKMNKVIGLVEDFGASYSVASVQFDGDRTKNSKITNDLESYGHDHRGDHKNNQKVEHLNTLRNKLENAKTEGEKAKLQRQIDQLEVSQHDALAGVGIDNELNIETYKAAVTRDLGKHLDAGKGVLAGLYYHWTKLYAIEDKGVRVQDPGQYDRSEMFISWEEARAMGYFWTNWVVQ